MIRIKRKAKPIKGEGKSEMPKRSNDPAQAKPMPHADGIHEWQPFLSGGQILYRLK